MMIEQATVVRYENGIATVQCSAKGGCGSCIGKSSCGTKSLSALAGEKLAPQFELQINEPLVVGDKIELGLAERSLLLSAFWLYGLPLFAVIISSVMFSQLFENELLVASLVLLTTVTTFGAIKKRLASSTQGEFTPVFLRKI